MQDVYYNDTPSEGDRGDLLRGEAFAGEYEPVTMSLVPLRDLGKVTVSVSDLTGPAGTIPSGAIDLGFVSNRISRVDHGRDRLHDQPSADHARRSCGRARRA